MRHVCPDFWRVQKKFWDYETWWCDWLKLLPYEINLAKPRIWRLMGLSRSHHESFRGSQEPLDPMVQILWPQWSLQHYILIGNPIYSEEPPIAANLPPPWIPSPRGRAPLLYEVDPRKKKVKAPPLPMGRRPLGLLPFRAVVGCCRHLLGLGHRGRRLSP
jgi:hypothetical protein